MINENEIRIGNWVHHTQQWSTMQGHDTLDFFDFKWTSSNWYQIGECLLSLEVLEPITLDEIWLLKFGFELLGSKWYVLMKEDIHFRYYYCTSAGCWKFEFNETRITIEYVHQLQNLYFCLVGEELVLQD